MLPHRIAPLALILLFCVGKSIAAGDPARGAKAFGQCTACHANTIEKP
jgi:cytochrome c2